MQTDFSLFCARLAEACRIRKVTHDNLCSSIGLGGRNVDDLHSHGINAIDIARLAKIADRLELSVDWLLGRTDVMELPGPRKKPRRTARLSFGWEET
jgi:hypothetical protein